MNNRRLKLFDNLGSGPHIRIGALTYLPVALVTIFASGWLWLQSDGAIDADPDTWTETIVVNLPLILAAMNLVGLGLLVLLLKKCRSCQSGPARRITAAMEKMSQGDVGWKITLRKGDELASVADSVSNASRSLADRIVRLQSDTRELSDLEEYVQDSIESDCGCNRQTLQALRRLKICTTRLKTEVDDFQVSLAQSKTNGKSVGTCNILI
jgi:methyl-accepting chemotaxis protein